jgi:hypothetical protein
VQVIPQHAIKAIRHTGALYSKNCDRAAGVGMGLFTTALGLYGGVLWSDELQGFIYMKQPLSLADSGLWSLVSGLWALGSGLWALGVV